MVHKQTEQQRDSRLRKERRLGEEGGYLAPLSYLLCTLAASAAVGAVIFYACLAEFGFGDDEGYVMLSVQQYLNGAPLYRELFSQYGPFFFQWESLLHTVAGLPLDHDTTRILSVLTGVLISVGGGLVVWRRTRSLASALLTQLTAGAVLLNFREAPGHPQELVMLLLTGLLLVTVWCRTLSAQVMFGGLFVAALMLVKINAGIFAGAALFMSLLPSYCRSEGGGAEVDGSSLNGQGFSERLLRPMIMLAQVAVLAMPALLMHKLIGYPWVFRFILLEVVSLLLLQLSLRSDDAPQLRTGRPLVWLLASVAIGIMLLSGISIAGGMAASELLRGVLLDPLRFPGQFFKIFWLRPADLLIPLVLSGSLFLWVRRASERRVLPLWSRVLVACALFAVLPFLIVDSLAFTQDLVRPFIAVAAAFTWVLMPRSGSESDGSQLVAGRMLGLVPLLFLLYAYPVAGTQLSLVLVPYLILAGVVLGERAPGETKSLTRIRWWSSGILTVLMCVSGGLLLITLQKEYSAAQPLQLSGTRLLRSRERDVAVYRCLVENLKAHAQSFYSLPGLNSLYLWTGIVPPGSMNSTNWMALWNDTQQALVKGELERETDRGAVVNTYIARFWMDANTPTGPLVTALLSIPSVLSVRRYELKLTEIPKLEQLRYIGVVIPGETLHRVPAPYPGQPGELFVAVEYGAWIMGSIVRAEMALIGKEGASVQVPLRVLTDRLPAGGGRWALLALPASAPGVEEMLDPSLAASGEEMAVIRLSAADTLVPVSIPIPQLLSDTLDVERQSLAADILATLLQRASRDDSPSH